MTASKQSQDVDGQRRCPKPVEFYDRVNLDNYCVWLVIKIKSVSMHGNMNIKYVYTEKGNVPNKFHKSRNYYTCS